MYVFLYIITTHLGIKHYDKSDCNGDSDNIRNVICLSLALYILV
jgi:hypothetical protein